MSAIHRILLSCAMLALLMVFPQTSRAQDNDLDIDYFYEQLEPYGRWTSNPRWGDVWSPDVQRDWRPYELGHWAYTDDNGWYWVSDEPFGWATFHYGRWVLDEYDGWLWVPGREWAPAWVSWRADDGDDGYIGWAPLPPDSGWGPDGELVYDDRYYEGPRFASMWIFVRPGYMVVPDMYRYVAPREQNFVILRRTNFLRGYHRYDRRVFNAGFDVRRFERAAGHPVQRMRLENFSGPRDRDFRDRPRGSSIQIFRPNIIERRDGTLRRPNFKPADGARGREVRGAPEGGGKGPERGREEFGRKNDRLNDRDTGLGGRDERGRTGKEGFGERGRQGDGAAAKGDLKMPPPEVRGRDGKEPGFNGPVRGQPKEDFERKGSAKGPTGQSQTFGQGDPKGSSNSTGPGTKGPTNQQEQRGGKSGERKDDRKGQGDPR